MRLKRARVRKYRSIIDSGDFDIEEMKTILVGPNEAGKSALLQALQQLNARVQVNGESAESVAADYLKTRGLVK